MHTRFRIFLLLVLAFTVAGGCSMPKIYGQKGTTFYTQHTMWSQHAMNFERVTPAYYAVGKKIPINTRVVLVDTGRNNLLRIPEQDRVIEFVNKRGYSGAHLDEAFYRSFGEEPLDLSRFAEGTRSKIEQGDIVPGMSKDAVLLARGRPPFHETPSLKLDKWVYWRHRLDREVLVFRDNRVLEIVD